MCRFVAKNIVANGYAKECLVSVAYNFGEENPAMLHVLTDSFDSRKIMEIVKRNFDFRPQAIIERLNLKNIKYLPTFLFDKESIIYPGEGTEFMPRYYNGKFALHQRCYAICDFNEAVNPQFLYFFLKTQNSYFIRNAVGSTVPSLRLDTFQKLKVVIPSKETQYSVYSFLSTLEQKLDVENSIMKMLLCQKRYLLRQMFI